MISFDEVNIDDAELILNWRVTPRVTKFMNTDIEFDLESQLEWLSSCYDKPHYYHWLIKIHEKPVGLLNISNFDAINKITSWGFYIGEEDSIGYGAFIPPFLYNFLFGTLSVENINVEIFFNNHSVIKLHQIHGYKFIPKKDRVIKKNGREVLLVAMNLSSDEWDNNKRFKRQIAKFPTEKWNARPDILRLS